MRTWLNRSCVAALALLALVWLTPYGAKAQSSVLNYFAQAGFAPSLPLSGPSDNPLVVSGSVYMGTAVVLTNAQVLALNSTPVTIVSAPPSGYYIDVIRWAASYSYVGAYSAGSDIKLFWGSRTTGNAASVAITASGFLTASASAIARAGGVPDNTNPPTSAAALVVQQVSPTAFTGGNASNTLTINVEYRIVKSGL
jgi:hypothetical protein